MKYIYNLKVKEGTYEVMNKVLNSHQALSNPIIDGKNCRITLPYSIEKTIKPEFIQEYKNDKVFQIKVQGIEDIEFLVLFSQLDYLDEVIVTGE